MKSFLLLISIYFMSIILVLATYVVSVGRISQHLGHADVILVLGCAAPNGQVSGMLRERLNEAIDLYQQGYAPYILVSGGVGKGEALSEAKVMQNYLIERGLPRERILVENRSLRTWENLAFSKQILDEYGFDSVLIVTSNFHLARSIFTADRLGYENYFFSGATSRVADWRFFFNYLREIPGLLYYFFASSYLHHNGDTRMRSKDVPFIPQHLMEVSDDNP